MKNPSNHRRISFNIIDLLLILIILAATAGLVYLFVSSAKDTTEVKNDTVMLEISLTADAFPEELQGKAAIGDICWEEASGIDLGEVIDVTYRQATVSHYDPETASMTAIARPGLYTMTITLRTKAERTDGYLRVGGIEILQGAVLHLRLPSLAATATVSGMTISEIPTAPIED